MTPEDGRLRAIGRAAAYGLERLEPLGNDEAEAIARFVRLYYYYYYYYYQHAAPEDVVPLDTADLYGSALAHYRFGQRREPGTAAARVYTPRVADHGWQSPHTAVEVVVDDMPFVVDSVRMELARHGLGIHRLVHPIVDGVSYVHVEVDRQSDPAIDAELDHDLRRVLGDVRAAVDDWHPMEAAMRAVADELAADPPPIDPDPEERAETEAFLAWLAGGNFTFLGYREYDLVVHDGADALVPVPGTGLGIVAPARLALRDDLYGQLRDVTAAVLAVEDVETWFDRKAAVVARCAQVLADIRAAGTFDLATLSVALRETHALTDG